MIGSAANGSWGPEAEQGEQGAWGGVSSDAESIVHLSLLNSAPSSNKSSEAGV